MTSYTRPILALFLVAGLLLAPVPPSALALEPVVWVCPSGACAGSPAYTTIQAGIDAVAPGGTVHVAAGTYTESLAIDKTLTLAGAGAGSTTVQGSVQVTNATGVTISGLKITGSGLTASSENYVVRLDEANNASLHDSSLLGLTGNTNNSYGLLVTRSDGVTCRRLTISGISAPSGRLVCGISLTGGSGHTIDGVSISGLASPTTLWGVQVHSATNSTLHDVRVDGGGLSPEFESIGIYVRGYSSGIAIENSQATGTFEGIGVARSGVTVSGCLLSGNDRGVRLFTGGTAVLHHNAITGNALGIQNDDTAGPAVDAAGNWWGSPTGPNCSANAGGTGDGVSRNVNASPWLGDGTDTQPDIPGFQPNPAPLYAIPTRLVFSTQPGGAAVGRPFATQPVLRGEDADGHLGINLGPVLISIAENPAGGTLSGTNPLPAVDGVASFVDLAIDRAGAGYTLRAEASGVTAATSAPFNVVSPPAAASLTPDHATAGAAGLELAVNGTGFAPGATVLWNGSPRPTLYSSATQLTAAIPAADLAAAGTAAVAVANPDGGTSNPLTFTVRPQPATVFVDPAWAGAAADSDPDGPGPASHYGYDAFAGLQAALDAVAAGGAVVAVGRHEGGLTVGTPGLTLQLTGATIGPSSPALTVAADDTTIVGGVFDGTGAAAGSPGLVVGAGVARLWVQGCVVSHWPGDGIRLQGAVSGLKLMGNAIHSNGGDGIELGGAPDGTVVIAGNSLRGNGGSGINAVEGLVHAAYNEWGHIDGPAAGDGVSGAVEADPWLYGHVYARVLPEPAQVREGEAFDVEIRVDAASLFGAQLELAFDPALLEVTGATPGLGTLAEAAQVQWDNAAGRLSYHSSLAAGEAAYSGAGGRLLTVHLRARAIAGAAAASVIDIIDEHLGLAAEGGIGIPLPPAGDGSVTILGEASVSGVVRLQGRADWSGAVVDAAPGEAQGWDPAPATTDAWGRYSLALVGDRYALTVAMARYLPAAATVTVADEGQTLATVELLGGDIDGTAGIGIGDVTGISGVLFGQQVDPATTAADVNYDGWVDILDLVLAAGNFGLSQSPWEL